MKIALVIAVVAVVVALAFSFRARRNQRVIGVSGHEYEIVNTSTDAKEADQQVLDNMRSLGADLTKETTVVFFLDLPTQSAAADAASQIYALGSFTVEYREGSGDWGWLCLATKRMSLDGTAIFEHTDLFDGIAAEHGGEYNGWEAEVVK